MYVYICELFYGLQCSHLFDDKHHKLNIVRTYPMSLVLSTDLQQKDTRTQIKEKCHHKKWVKDAVSDASHSDSSTKIKSRKSGGGARQLTEKESKQWVANFIKEI